jgi:hypothetical protein
LNAAHFRERAATARDLAKSGDDLRLSRMLLEVAHDLEAEAEAMEAETGLSCRHTPLTRLHASADTTGAVAIQITGFSIHEHEVAL